MDDNNVVYNCVRKLVEDSVSYLQGASSIEGRRRLREMQVALSDLQKPGTDVPKRIRETAAAMLDEVGQCHSTLNVLDDANARLARLTVQMEQCIPAQLNSGLAGVICGTSKQWARMTMSQVARSSSSRASVSQETLKAAA
jgi:hypothetical protein